MANIYTDTENSVYGSSAGHVWTDPQYAGEGGWMCVECGEQPEACDDLCVECAARFVLKGELEMDPMWTVAAFNQVAEIINEAKRGAADMQLDREKEIAS